MMNMNGHHQATMCLIDGGATSMMDDSEPSSPESANGFEEADLMQSAINDEVSATLAAAGPIGVAAAAAIASNKKRKRPPHSFETNPSIRKRQQTRLLRKLRAVIEEYTTRVGQQAVVLCVTPGRTHQSANAYRVFGSQPLETVVRNARPEVMRELEQALAAQAPAPNASEHSHQHELPGLVIDGIPTPLDKMTQGQLRQFVPVLLRYSTGRGKPHWGDPHYRPVWWPQHLPWANVRQDTRSQACKDKVSWTAALRSIVRNCYRHHGREDLLPEFHDEASQHAQMATAFAHHTMVQTINNPDGTMSIIHIDTGPGGDTPQVVTLADGTQAQVVHAETRPHDAVKTEIFYIQQSGHEASAAVQTLSEVAAGTHHLTAADMNNSDQQHTLSTLADANLTEGQILLTGAEGLGGAGAEKALECGQGEGGGGGGEAAGQRCNGLCCEKNAEEEEEDSEYVITQMQSGDGQTIGMVSIPVSVYQTVVTSMGGEMHGTQTVDVGGNQQLQIAMAPYHTTQDLHIKEMETDEEESDTDNQMVVSFTPGQNGQQHQLVLQHNQRGSVPDATQAVEVVTVEPELEAQLS